MYRAERGTPAPHSRGGRSGAAARRGTDPAQLLRQLEVEPGHEVASLVWFVGRGWWWRRGGLHRHNSLKIYNVIKMSSYSDVIN